VVDALGTARLDREPARHAQVDEEEIPISEMKNDAFAAAGHTLDRSTLHRFRQVEAVWRYHVLTDVNYATDSLCRHVRRQRPYDRLNFRQFRHGMKLY
jgi:hypothetical protein